MDQVGLLFALRGEAAPFVRCQRGVPVSYELTPANVAQVVVRLRTELLAEARAWGEEVGRRLLLLLLLGDLAYRSEELEEALAECGVSCW